jgi:hypothetical protein
MFDEQKQRVESNLISQALAGFCRKRYSKPKDGEERAPRTWDFVVVQERVDYLLIERSSVIGEVTLKAGSP